MDLSLIVLITTAALGVLLLVLAVIAVVVLLPPVRRAMRERAQSSEAQSEADVESGGADPKAASGNGAEPEKR